MVTIRSLPRFFTAPDLYVELTVELGNEQALEFFKIATALPNWGWRFQIGLSASPAAVYLR
jgi:hypothetical protein